MRRIVLLAALLAPACGKKGSHKAEPPPPEPTVTGVIDTSIKTVSGNLYVGDDAHPAEGFELWTLDHTGGSLRRDQLPPSGAFSLPVEAFGVDHVYTMHVVRAMQLVADVDVSIAQDGVQQAFTYEGGPGFDMGALTLAVDAHGEPDMAVTSVQGKIAGGFSAQPASTATLASFPAPEALSRLAFGSQLYVFEPNSLLHSFIQRAQNPALYAADLATFSRVGLRADGAEAGVGKKVQLQEGGVWLTAARQESGALWSTTNYLADTADKKAFSASVLPGAVLPLRSIALLRVQVGDTDPEAHVPRVLDAIVTVPPILNAIDLGSGSVAAIDYAKTGPNGLTQGFCRTGNVRLAIDPPLDQDGAAVSFDTVEVAVDYYGVAADGKILAVDVVPDDFPAPYNAVIDGSWDPATRTFKLFPAPDLIPIPGDLFLVNAKAGGVFYLRLRVYAKNSKGATEGAIAVWFDNAC
jgi:hypothetical protein